jgi:hypothetical protein
MPTRKQINQVIPRLCILLSKYSSQKMQKSNTKNPRDLLLKLTDQIKKDNLPLSGLRLTRNSYTNPVHQIGNLSLFYDYKRDKLTTQLISKEGFDIYFDASQKKRFFLLNSGQASIFLCLNWLTRFAQIRTISSIGLNYVGANELQSVLNFKFCHKRQNNSNTLWICSAYFKPEDINRLQAFKNVKYLVVDTTCWSMESRELQSILKIFSLSLVFIIRSHSKLDMGGVEYGSLGSILVLGSKSDDPKILLSLEKTIKLCGLTPSLDDIPPYLFDKNFNKLNSLRILKLRKECLYYKKSLKKSNLFGLVYPHHGAYFFLKLPANFKLNQVQGLIHFFVVSSRNNKISLANVPSFGFNFISFNYYQDSNTQEHILRFCPSIERSENLKFAIILNEIMSGFV